MQSGRTAQSHAAGPASTSYHVPSHRRAHYRTCRAVLSPGPAEVGLQHANIRPVSGPQELQEVAELRAQAFYEEDRSRFVESFKKKFARGEVESLQQRTAPAPPNGVPACECLVALDEDGSRVVGCIDLRLPRRATARHPAGVPPEDEAGCYLLNVVVDEEQRGRGVGKTLMRAAMRRAVDRWASERLYTHVAADNEVALRLYQGCGFKQHSVDAQALDQASVLGKLLLLQATAAEVLQAH